MKRISIVKNQITGAHFLYDGPVFDSHEKLREKHSRSYAALDALINCARGDLKLNPEKPIDVYIEGYSPEDITYIKAGLETKFNKIYFNK